MGNSFWERDRDRDKEDMRGQRDVTWMALKTKNSEKWETDEDKTDVAYLKVVE